MKVLLVDGQLCISYGDKIIAKDIGTYFKHRNKYWQFIRTADHGEWHLTQTEDGTEARCDNAVIRFTPYGRGMLVKSTLTNDGAAIRSADDFVPIFFQTDSPIVNATGSEVKIKSVNKTNEMGAEVRTRNPVYGEKLDFSDFSAIRTADGTTMVIGFASSFRYFGNLEICGEGMVTLRNFTEYHRIPEGKTLESDACLILPCDDINEGIEEFTRASAEYISAERGAALPSPFTIPCGYCTWYYYLDNITSERIVNSLEVIKKHSDRLPLKYYQIDDGWFRCFGDWTPNEKFPEGMKYCADKIKEAGLIPGLWLSPLRVSKDTPLAKEHPEYFVREREPKEGEDPGHLDGGGFYLLDYSVPGVCEFMTSVIKRVTEEWGFEYLKVDHITSSIGPYVHSGPDFNACRNHIRCLEVIRNAAPEGTFILDCTSPFVGAVGLADAARISGDIMGDWETLAEVFGRRVLKRWYYHNTFFTNDADCLIIRKPENEDEECRHHCTRNGRDIKTYITAMAASGGALMLSDKLELLSNEQIKLITYLFPQNLKPAVPLDMAQADLAGILDFGVRGKTRIVALINWYDAPHTLSVNAGRKHAFEFWERKYLGITDGMYSVEIEPHGCRVLYFTDADKPAVIGSADSIVPDIKQDYDGKKLTFTFGKKDETLYIAAHSLSGEGCDTAEIQPGIFTATQTGDAFTVSLIAE